MAMTQPIERYRPNAKTKDEPLRAAVYARHSSSKQNAKSCEEQVMRIRYLVDKGEIKSQRYLDRPVIIDERWVISDEAISGRSAARDGYQHLQDAMAGKGKPFDLLLVDDLSRLNRDLGNMLGFCQMAKARGIEVIGVSDNVSSEGLNSRMFITVKGMINDFTNEAHAARTLRGMEMKILKGLSCGDTCYGYKSVATRFEKEGSHEVPRDYKIMINEEQAAIVRRIYKLFTDGHGRSAICKILNDEKISWPGFHSATPVGKGWSPSTIHKILNNEKYIGVWSWKKSIYQMDPISGRKIRQARPEKEWISHHDGKETTDDLRIVQQGLWNKVQAMFKKIHDNDAHGEWGRFFPFIPKHMLTQILKCGSCGASMVLISGRAGGYYACHDAHRKGICDNKRLIKRSKIERVIIGHVLSLLKDDNLFELAAKKFNDLMRAKLMSSQVDISVYEQELAVTEIELKNLAEAVMKGGESRTISDAIDAKERRQRWLKFQIKQTRALQQEKIYVTPAAMKERFKKMADILKKKPGEAYNALVKLFPTGLKMRWVADHWEIAGMMTMDNKGGTNEMRLEVK